MLTVGGKKGVIKSEINGETLGSEQCLAGDEEERNTAFITFTVIR